MSPEGGNRADPPAREPEVYLERVRMGNAVRVTAIDSASLREASVVGPLSAHPGDLDRLAIAKLRRLVGAAPKRPNKNAPPDKGRGVIV